MCNVVGIFVQGYIPVIRHMCVPVVMVTPLIIVKHAMNNKYNGIMGHCETFLTIGIYPQLYDRHFTFRSPSV